MSNQFLTWESLVKRPQRRPEIAQAIRDAALSQKPKFLGAPESIILANAFMWPSELGKCTADCMGFHNWIFSDEGRTYMLLVSEALS